MRIGIIGAARIAPEAILAPARQLAGIEVACVGARSKTAARNFALEHNIPDACEGYAPVVAHPNVDLVYVALPISEHCKWAVAAAEAGKHVLVEKSFAMNFAEAEAMVAAGRASGVRVVEAFHYRYHPAFQAFLDLIASGKVGKIQHIDAEFSIAIAAREGEIRHNPTLGGGAMRDLGCYPLHWIGSLVGYNWIDIEVTAKMAPTAVDETLCAHLTFDSGTTARLRASMTEQEVLKSAIMIEGEGGVLEFTNPLAPHTGASISLDRKKIARFDENSGSTYLHQLRALHYAVAYDHPLITDGEAILRQQTALDQILALANKSAFPHLRE